MALDRARGSSEPWSSSGALCLAAAPSVRLDGRYRSGVGRHRAEIVEGHGRSAEGFDASFVPLLEPGDEQIEVAVGELVVELAGKATGQRIRREYLQILPC
jgi:hypothetical protein